MEYAIKLQNKKVENNVKPTLLVLAAGMGSRYGSLKQIDAIGPYGETIIDYSIYDAIKAGFGKVVFVIRKSFEQDFRNVFIAKLRPIIPVSYVFQELENITSDILIPTGRIKPWGTVHAVLMAKNVIHEPFAVINGDDFYGSGAFKIMANYLNALQSDLQNQFAMVGYQVGNTMSEYGSVSRGICKADKNDLLLSITERTNIQFSGGKIVHLNTDETEVFIKNETLVSMNFWGFTPEFFKQAEDRFEIFLKDNSNSLKSEFYIPTCIDNMIGKKTANVKVLKCTDKWFGVTYKEDKPKVIEKLTKLIESGVYPAKLWNQAYEKSNVFN